MKKSMFKSSLRCAALMLAALAFASCAEENLGPEVTPADEPEQTETKITTVALASIAGDASRVTYAAATRADEQTGDEESDELKPGDLRLIATIANPSKKVVFGFTPEETDDGRWLSATSVFYNPNDQTYYATYHIQGNNYNTELETDVAGAIQMFKVDETGAVTLDDYFRAAKPAEEDYDFNHIYFDNTDQRIIVVGHKQNPAATEKGGNTRAIIGTFDPTAKTLKYAPINTAEKAYDAEGKSLGYKDAGDANCVVRANDAPNYKGESYGWDYYFVATRKGMAVLSAKAETLFQPTLTEEGVNYFLPTPGSAKYVSLTGTSSHVGLLYLADPHDGDVTYETSSTARVAQLSVNTWPNLTVTANDWKDLPTSHHELDIQNFDASLTQYEDCYIDLPNAISPVDGKNTLSILGTNEYYAALGKGGMYCNNGLDGVNKAVKFGDRPVNCVATDNAVNESGHSYEGYLYVANGSKLTVLNRETLKEIASWNMPSTDKEGNAIASSANFVTVTKADNGERTIVVAYGQEGVCIFKFLPPSK